VFCDLLVFFISRQSEISWFFFCRFKCAPAVFFFSSFRGRAAFLPRRAAQEPSEESNHVTHVRHPFSLALVEVFFIPLTSRFPPPLNFRNHTLRAFIVENKSQPRSSPLAVISLCPLFFLVIFVCLCTPAFPFPLASPLLCPGSSPLVSNSFRSAPPFFLDLLTSPHTGCFSGPPHLVFRLGGRQSWSIDRKVQRFLRCLASLLNPPVARGVSLALSLAAIPLFSSYSCFFLLRFADDRFFEAKRENVCSPFFFRWTTGFELRYRIP